jgi:hypothetical protein
VVEHIVVPGNSENPGSVGIYDSAVGLDSNGFLYSRSQGVNIPRSVARMGNIQGIGTGNPDGYGILHVDDRVARAKEKEIVLCMGLRIDETISSFSEILIIIKTKSAILPRTKRVGYHGV